MQSVGFQSGWNVLKDDGRGPYTAPQWQKSPAKSDPYLYSASVSGKNHLTVSGVWNSASALPSSATVMVRGTATGGIVIPATPASLDATRKIITSPPITAASAFANATKYYNTLDIDWEVSINGGAWRDAGRSQNPMYICLHQPVDTGVELYRTVIHLACSNDGASNAAEAAEKTWYLFSSSTPLAPKAGPKGVTRWDGSPLYYYKPGTTLAQNAAYNLEDLLDNRFGGSGKCGVWARLLNATWNLNGATSTVVTAIINPIYQNPPNNVYLFWVNSWTTNDLSINYKSITTTSLNELLPSPPGGDYGPITNSTGTAGQNSPTPSQKCWGDHAFVSFNGIYYDPSYGLIYSNLTDVQNTAIAYFGKALGKLNDGRYVFHLFKTTTPMLTIR